MDKPTTKLNEWMRYAKDLEAKLEEVKRLRSQLQRRGDDGVNLGLQNGGQVLFVVNCHEVVGWLDEILDRKECSDRESGNGEK